MTELEKADYQICINSFKIGSLQKKLGIKMIKFASEVECGGYNTLVDGHTGNTRSSCLRMFMCVCGYVCVSVCVCVENGVSLRTSEPGPDHITNVIQMSELTRPDIRMTFRYCPVPFSRIYV